MTEPADLIALAKQLVGNAGASRRAAVGRSYYAAFHSLQDVVRPMVETHQIGKHNCVDHGATVCALRDWAEKHPDKKLAMGHGVEAKKIYHLLAACRDARERADYMLEPSSDLAERDAGALIAKAEQVIKFAMKMAAKMQ